MSVSWVPPLNTSPYQNGVAPATNCESLKVGLRQAVVSGKDASFVPFRQRQAEDASTNINVAAWTGSTAANKSHTHQSLFNRILIAFISTDSHFPGMSLKSPNWRINVR